MTDLLTNLLQRLDEPAARFVELDAYYSAAQPLAFLAPEATLALGSRFGRMASNIPRLAVTSLAERLRVTGFSGSDDDAGLWSDWISNDLDQLAGVAHREALAIGSAYLIVWANPDGSPKVSVESARQVAIIRDPGTRRVLAAIKRWSTETTTEATLFEPDQITRLRSNSIGATTAGFQIVETIANPLGWTPVVQLCNGDRLLDDGVSEIDDLKPLVDAINKSLVDLMVTSEYVGRPRRWASGVELVETDVLDPVTGLPALDPVSGEPLIVTTNPLPEGNRSLISENESAKFGQLPSADLAGYEASVRVLLGQVSAVSGLPPHYLGVHGDQPASADALRASEASLTAKAEARQAQFGRSWEQVARLMTAVRHGVDPDSVAVRVQWADPSTRSVAQEADSVTKLFASGLLPAATALRKLGYSADEISTINNERNAS